MPRLQRHYETLGADHRILNAVLVRCLSWTLPVAAHKSMAQILASELRARFNLSKVGQLMEAKETKGNGAQQPMSPHRLLPTPRERLHQNIERLQALNNQLFWDQLKQAELLTVIELVGFKIQHLSRQIQEAEDLGEAQVHACLSEPGFPSRG